MTLPEQVDRIAGTRRAPTEVLASALHDPNTGALLQPQRATDAAGLEQALVAAWDVHTSHVWASVPVAERADWLDAIGAELDKVAHDIAVADALTTGVVIAHTTLFAGSLGGTFRSVAELLRSGWTTTDVSADGRRVELHRLPWGPAALLVPWNAPAAIAAGKVANALAAGCPAILKPTEWAPSSCNLLADAIEAVNLPPGVFQMVHGGAVQGATLTGDPRVRAVSFTGGVGAGRAIARQGAEDFKALQLELGGSNPAIVRSDADLDATAKALAEGCLKLNGQWCEAPRRVIAHAEIADELGVRLLHHLGDVTIGSSMDAASEMGPLAHGAHHKRIAGQVAALVEAGGEAHEAAGGLPDEGYFYPPVLVTGVANEACLDEIFGPVLTLHTFADDGEALAMANAAPSGLAGYVFAGDVEAALALGARIHAGEVKVNGTSLLDMTPQSTQSFWGMSGIGGHGRREVAQFFAGSRIVGQDLVDAPL